MSSPVTANFTTLFTTFTPESSTSASNPCGASLGLGKAYAFNILSGAAALDFNGDGTIDINDRSFALSSGIPSSVVPVFTNQGIVAIVGVSGGTQNLGLLTRSDPQRTHWIEGTDF